MTAAAMLTLFMPSVTRTDSTRYLLLHACVLACLLAGWLAGLLAGWLAGWLAGKNTLRTKRHQQPLQFSSAS
jgi:hypothetical protein